VRTGSQASSRAVAPRRARSNVAGRPGAAVGAAFLVLALAACGGSASGSTRRSKVSSSPEQVKPTDADGLAQLRVETYLDAMRAKDVAKGRAQLCASGQAEFDTSATDDGGDFADHFTVEASAINSVEVDPGGRRVTASVTLKARSSGASAPVSVAFTVSDTASDWCILSEELLSRPPVPAPPTPTAPATSP
jgi:hypothetical protein